MYHMATTVIDPPQCQSCNSTPTPAITVYLLLCILPRVRCQPLASKESVALKRKNYLELQVEFVKNGAALFKTQGFANTPSAAFTIAAIDSAKKASFEC